MVELSIDTKSKLWKGSSGDRLKYARDRKNIYYLRLRITVGAGLSNCRITPLYHGACVFN